MYKNYKESKHFLASIEAIDYFFAKEIFEYIKFDSSDFFHILIALSFYYRHGSTCLLVRELADNRLWFQDADTNMNNKGIPGYTFPSQKSLLNLLKNINFKNTPIVYKNYALYIRKIWLYKQEIISIIKAKAELKFTTNISNIYHTLKKIFTNAEEEIDWQKVAVANSLVRNFSIISGGPGTGKTSIITKLILAFNILSDYKLDIRLLAPTNKAVRKLNESIKQSSHIILDKQAITIHSFLGMKSNSIKLKYYAEHRSPCDVVIIDEASMINIDLFIKMIRALKHDCKIILLGDINHLTFVNTENLLQEFIKICNSSSKQTLRYLKKATQYNQTNLRLNNDYTVFLKKNYRSNYQITKLANYVIVGDVVNSIKILHNADMIDYYNWSDFDNILISYVNKHFTKLFKANNIKDVFKILSSVKILVACESAYIGIKNLNKKIEKILGKNSNFLYNAKPIMIAENDYVNSLFNGDIGIVWNNKVYFEHNDTYFKEIHISKLLKYETVYAMTIYRSQNYEFDNVMIILPNKYNKLLSRKILYNGINRAKNNLSIIADLNTWKCTLCQK